MLLSGTGKRKASVKRKYDILLKAMSPDIRKNVFPVIDIETVNPTTPIANTTTE
jgi:hypothetical protein